MASFEDLLPFLNENRNDLKLRTLDVLLAQKWDESTLLDILVSDRFNYIPVIFSLLKDGELSLKTSFLLVNILSETHGVLKFVNGIEIIHDILKLLENKNKDSKVFLILLANLTIEEEIAQSFVEVVYYSPTPPVHVHELIESFLNYDPQDEIFFESDDDRLLADPWQQVSSILCNISRLDKGRDVLFTRSKRVIPRLLLQISSRNITRRRGAVGTLKNLLFNVDEHQWLLQETETLTTILLPLLVNTPFTEAEELGMDPKLQKPADDKQPEPDIGIVLMLLECILLLCQRRIIREMLRKRKVYPIIRNLDYLLGNDTVSDIIFELVNLLMRDEDPNESNPSNQEVRVSTSMAVAIKADDRLSDNALLL